MRSVVKEVRPPVVHIDRVAHAPGFSPHAGVAAMARGLHPAEAQPALSTGQVGSVTTTMRTFTEDEFKEIVRTIP